MSRGHFDHHGLRWALGGGGYQFYTTSPTVQWATWKNADYDFHPGGSAIYVPTPKLALLPSGEVDQTKTKIFAYPTGSTVEESNNGYWYYRQTPSLLTGTAGLNEIMNKELFKVKDVWQINGIPQHVYYEVSNESNKIKYQLLDSWVQVDGQIHGLNALFPTVPSYVTDSLFDVAPAKLIKNPQLKAPDTDWFGRACVQTVEGRRFVIMHDTNGVFHCWPEDAEIDASAYEGQYAIYGAQSYKANVPSARAKSVKPEYPDWVSPAISWRDKKLEVGENGIFEPRYSFSFNSTGTRACSVMIERKLSDATFYEIDYTPEGLGLAEYPYDTPYLPTEVQLPDIKVDPNYLRGELVDQQDIAVDRCGFVELEFIIEIEQGGDFSFEANVVNEKSPDLLDELGQGVLVSVAYAANLDWSKAVPDNTNRTPRTSYRITKDVLSIEKDDLLSVFMELYWHKDQKAVVDGYFGIPSLLVPAKTVATFYKGTSFNDLLTKLPLSQSHGKGYSYSYLNSEVVLPTPPHGFVNNTNETLSSRFPYNPESGCSNELYYYSAKIESLDLSTLSFYYTTRLLEQKRAESPFATTMVEEYYGIMNRAKTLCNVCVMGYVIDRIEVGDSKLPSTWIEGWSWFSANDELEDGVEKIPETFSHGLRGAGLSSNGSGFVAPIDSTLTTESWINNLYGQGIEYYSSRPCSPWWLQGACYRIVNTALSLCLMKAYYGGTTLTWTRQTGQGELVDTVVLADFKNLFNLQEDDIPELLNRIFDMYDDCSMIYSRVGYDTHGYVEVEVTHTLATWYSKNPFTTAYSGLTKDLFVESASGLLWMIVKRLQKTAMLSLDDLNRGTGFGVVAFTGFIFDILGESVYFRGGGPLFNSPYNRLYLPDKESKLGKIAIHAKNIEAGALLYNTAIQKHFHTKSWLRKILVTPEGHISYYKKNLWDMNDEFCASYALYYQQDDVFNDNLSESTISRGNKEIMGIDPLSILSPYGGIAPTFTNDHADWKMVEGLSWYYNTLVTKHLYIYNLAYQDVAEEDKKKNLLSFEVFESKYSDSDYMPDFRGELTDDGVRYIYPFDAEFNYEYTSFEYLSIPGETHNIQESTEPPYPVDPRPKITDLRLSPLFF